MYIIYSNATGQRIEAVLLAAGRGRLRVVPRGFSETVDLCFTEGQWRTEIGDVVDLESMISDGGTEAAQMCAEFFPLTFNARQ